MPLEIRRYPGSEIGLVLQDRGSGIAIVISRAAMATDPVNAAAVEELATEMLRALVSRHTAALEAKAPTLAPAPPDALTPWRCPHCLQRLFGPDLERDEPEAVDVIEIQCGPEHLVTWADGRQVTVAPGGETRMLGPEGP